MIIEIESSNMLITTDGLFLAFYNSAVAYTLKLNEIAHTSQSQKEVLFVVHQQEIVFFCCW